MRQAVAAAHLKARYRPVLPPGGGRLWELFWLLHGRRQYAFGPNPISLQEIDAASRILGVRLRPWEAGVVCEMDLAWGEATQQLNEAPKAEAVTATPANVRSFFKIMGHGRNRPRKTGA